MSYTLRNEVIDIIKNNPGCCHGDIYYELFSRRGIKTAKDAFDENPTLLVGLANVLCDLSNECVIRERPKGCWYLITLTSFWKDYHAKRLIFRKEKK